MAVPDSHPTSPLAGYIEAVVDDVTPLIQRYVGQTGTGTTLAVTFPKPFGGIPTVATSVGVSAPRDFQVGVISTTTTGFTLTIQRVSGSNSFFYSYIAIGPRP